jgi:hypothetical protein
MSHELRHEVTMVVNGESRKVMVDADPKPAEAAPQAQAPKAVAPKPAAKKTAAKKAPAKKPAAKKAATQKPSLLQRAKAAVSGKGNKT